MNFSHARPPTESSSGATLSELKEVLSQTLAARGALSSIKARIRAEIFKALDEQEPRPPQLSNENLLINELIREYLVFNNYHHAASVLLEESGQPKDPIFDRRFINERLNVQDVPGFENMPLLYGLVSAFERGTEAPNPISRSQHFSRPKSGIQIGTGATSAGAVSSRNKAEHLYEHLVETDNQSGAGAEIEAQRQKALRQMRDQMGQNVSTGRQTSFKSTGRSSAMRPGTAPPAVFTSHTMEMPGALPITAFDDEPSPLQFTN